MTKKRLFATYGKQKILDLLRHTYDEGYFFKINPSDVQGKESAYLILLIRQMTHNHNMTLLSRRRLLEKLFEMTNRYEYALKKLEYLELRKTVIPHYKNLHLVSEKQVKEADCALRVEMMKQIKGEKL